MDTRRLFDQTVKSLRKEVQAIKLSSSGQDMPYIDSEKDLTLVTGGSSHEEDPYTGDDRLKKVSTRLTEDRMYAAKKNSASSCQM